MNAKPGEVKESSDSLVSDIGLEETETQAIAE